MAFAANTVPNRISETTTSILSENHITALSRQNFKPYIKKVFHPAIGRKTVFRVTTKIPINLWAAQPL